MAWSVTLLEVSRNTGAYLPNYKNLRELWWNQVEERNISLIYQIVEGSVCPKLTRLLLNLNKLQSTSYCPSESELNIFRLLYAELLGRMKPGQTPGEPAVSVYFNGVKLDFSRQFDDYAFGQRLVDVHRHNLKNGLTVNECRTVFCVDYPHLPDELFEPENLADERHFGPLRFASLYPGILEVVLDNSISMKAICSEEQFIRFLKSFQALVSLKLTHTGFSDHLYSRLVDEVHSLRTLDCFLLIEPKLTQQRINLRFLDSLFYLRHLRSNLVTQMMMFDLIQRQPIGAGYEFEFCQEGLGDLFVCAILRIEDDGSSKQWFLRVGRQRFGEERSSQIYQSICSFPDLQSYFLCTSNAVVSAHWLRD